ncbi:hypothetical protein AMECASPLE_033746 [Ameca splendens]|uniref:Uncharacterized protein n=1 Tax=Ameca splendens TaxID=208324 RepID=A0ABV0XVX2_9TELE
MGLSVTHQEPGSEAQTCCTEVLKGKYKDYLHMAVSKNTQQWCNPGHVTVKCRLCSPNIELLTRQPVIKKTVRRWSQEAEKPCEVVLRLQTGMQPHRTSMP